MIEVRKFWPVDGASIEPRPMEKRIMAGFHGDRFSALFAQHPGWTAWAEGKPVFAAGFVVLWPGVAEVWALTSGWVDSHPIAFHRTVARFLEDTAEGLGLWRVQVVIESGHDVSRAWIRRLGFQFEGIRPALGPRGEDFVSYAKIYPQRRPKAEALQGKEGA